MRTHLKKTLILGTALLMSALVGSAVKPDVVEAGPVKLKQYISPQGGYCEGECGNSSVCCP